MGLDGVDPIRVPFPDGRNRVQARIRGLPVYSLLL